MTSSRSSRRLASTAAAASACTSGSTRDTPRKASAVAGSSPLGKRAGPPSSRSGSPSRRAPNTSRVRASASSRSWLQRSTSTASPGSVRSRRRRGTQCGALTSVAAGPTHSSRLSRDSVMTLSGVKSSPKTVCAKPTIVAGSPRSPSVADVATGVILAERAGPVRVGDRGVIVGPVALEGHAEPAKEHRHVGALGSVVGVELVEDEVGQRRRALLPDRLRRPVAAGAGRASCSWSAGCPAPELRIAPRSLMSPRLETIVRRSGSCSPV